MIKVISLVVIALLVTAVGSVDAAQNSYLNFTGETQGDASELKIKSADSVATKTVPVSDQKAVPLQVDSTQADTPEIDDEVLTTDRELSSSEVRGTETEDIGIVDKDVPEEMNKAELIESISSGVAPETKGTETEDIGIIRVDDSASGSVPPGTETAPSQIKVLLLSPSEEGDVITREADSANQSKAEKAEDDFGFISGGAVYVRAGYVKLGDIKGESSDTASGEGGSAGLAWTVDEEGDSEAKKPKEIVVVGSKAADSSTPKLFEAVCEGQFATCEPQGATTPDHLIDFAQRTVSTYESVNEVRIDDTKIEMVDTQPFKLLGFIPTSLEQTVSVSVESDSFGRVKVKFPWYHVLGRKTVRPHDLVASMEESINTMEVSSWKVADFDAVKSSEDRPTETYALNFNEIKAQTLQTMSNVSKSYNESDFNFVSR